jgi:hypothetical protein
VRGIFSPVSPPPPPGRSSVGSIDPRPPPRHRLPRGLGPQAQPRPPLRSMLEAAGASPAPLPCGAGGRRSNFGGRSHPSSSSSPDCRSCPLPPVVRRGQPPRARAAGPHRPYAGGRTPPPPPPPSVPSRGIRGSGPPPPPPPPPAVAARGFMADARRASGPRVDADGFTEVVGCKRQASRSPPCGGSRSPHSSSTGVPTDFLKKCFNCFGLNHVVAHCSRLSLLQLPSTRASQELLPIAVGGSSYSCIPARSARPWSRTCPASASTPGSRGAATL